MSKTANQKDYDNLLNKGDKLNHSNSSDGGVTSPKKSLVEQEELYVPRINELSLPQWILVGVLYVFFLLLVVFIIYISCTWNKDRTNEYT